MDARQTELLLNLSCQPLQLARDDVMRAATQIVSCEKVAAFLWLEDRDKSQAYLDRLETTGLDHRNSLSLSRLFVTRNPKTLKTIESQVLPDRLLTWCESHGLSPATARIMELTAQYAEKKRTIGYLQVVGSEPFDLDDKDALDRLGNVLARTIDWRRQQRHLQAVLDFSFRMNLVPPASEWFKKACMSLAYHLAAEVCLFFRLTPDLRFQASAGAKLAGETKDELSLLAPEELPITSMESAIGQIAIGERRSSATPGDFRVVNLNDPIERRAVLGPERNDFVSDIAKFINPSELTSGLLMAVRPDSQRGAYGHEPPEPAVAVLLAINKKKGLVRCFSETDARIAESVCRILAGIIPSIEQQEAIRNLSEKEAESFAVSLESDEAKSNLFEWLYRNIPGVTCADILLRELDIEEPRVRHLGGPVWFQNHHALLDDRAKLTALPHRDGKPAFRFIENIPHLDPDSGKLILGLRRGAMTSVEESLIRFAATELSHVLRSERDVKRRLDEVVQIRHMIRAQFSGISKIEPLRNLFRRIYDGGWDPAGFFTERVARELDTASEYTKRVGVLLEEARFLVQSVSRSQLRISATNINVLIRGVVACLESFAARANVGLEFRSDFRSSQEFPLDHDLIEIAIFNLVDNAIKYSVPNQSVVLRLTGDPIHWNLVVSNRGTLVPADDRDRIFWRFERRTQQSEQVGAQPGTGLGLFITRMIVEAHGGSVNCQSTAMGDDPAHTEFTMRLPT